MKQALFNIVSGDRNYVRGQVYTNEEVADLDQADFIDTEATPTAQVSTEDTSDEIVGDIDSQKKTDGGNGGDDNKGDLTPAPVVHQGVVTHTVA